MTSTVFPFSTSKEIIALRPSSRTVLTSSILLTAIDEASSFLPYNTAGTCPLCLSFLVAECLRFSLCVAFNVTVILIILHYLNTLWHQFVFIHLLSFAFWFHVTRYDRSFTIKPQFTLKTKYYLFKLRSIE